MAAEQIDATLAALGYNTTKAGAATSIGGWALSSEVGVLVGIVIGITGLLIQWYYRRKQDRRDEEEHAMRMAKGRQ